MNDAVQAFAVVQCLGQQGRGFVDVFADDDGLVFGVAAKLVGVMTAGQAVVDGQHHDFVDMGGLAFVAHGGRGRTTR